MLLSIFGIVAGLITSFAPELLKAWNKKQDNAHELDMFKLQIQAAETMHRDRMEEINAEADIKEATVLHEPIPSYGVQMIDKMEHAGISQWLYVPLVYLYSFLDTLQIIVRPAITLAITGFYIFVKYSSFQLAMMDTTLWKAALSVWNDNDLAIFLMVLSYWFGNRMMSKINISKPKLTGWNG